MAYEATLISTLRAGEGVSGEGGRRDILLPSSPTSKALLHHVAGPRHAPYSTFSLLSLFPLPLRPPFLFHPYFSPFNLPSSEGKLSLSTFHSPLACFSFFLSLFLFFFFLCWREIHFGYTYVYIYVCIKIRGNWVKLGTGEVGERWRLGGIGGPPRRGSFEEEETN